MKKNEPHDRIISLAVFVFCLGGFLISDILVELEPDVIIYKILTVFFLSILLAYLVAQFIYLIIIWPKNKAQEKTKDSNNDNDDGII